MKVLIAENAINSDEIELEQMQLDTPEIQSMDVREIAAFSAKWAADKIGKPVVVEDNSLWIESLNGFPASFVAYVDRTIGEEGILKLMKNKENRAAKFVMAAAYCEPDGEPMVEADELKGVITTELHGSYGRFADFFFIPEGYEKTMGCFPDEERKLIWPHGLWKRLAKKILLK